MLWMGLCGMWVLYTHVYAESIYGADKETASTDILHRFNTSNEFFVRAFQKDAINERYDDLYLEIKDGNGMLYNVSTTNQLALYLSMNKTELVEKQYRSMYDAGTSISIRSVRTSDHNLNLSIIVLRNTRSSENVTDSTNHWNDDECSFWDS